MSIDFTWLEENFFKKRLAKEEKDFLTSRIDAVSFSIDNTILKQGSMVQALYILHSGNATIDCKVDGENMHVGPAHPGDLIGEMSFLSAAEASVTVTASEECGIYVLTRDTLIQLMRKHPELAYSIFAHLLNHTARMVQRMNAEKITILKYVSECPS